MAKRKVIKIPRGILGVGTGTTSNINVSSNGVIKIVDNDKKT